MDAGNVISGSSAFSKSSLHIWKFLVHVLLNPRLENFEHSLLVCEMSETVIVWTSFGISLSLSLFFFFWRGWQECTEELYKKDLHDPDNHDGVITYLEPDILEREVKWALVSITTHKASEVEGIPAELFQILKDDAVKVLHSMWQQIWKTQQWPQDWKRSIFIPIPKKGSAKECSNYHTIALISHASKVMLKILQARFQQYVNR